jgi:glycosyltransferase involved in cell wall biosynthesis
MISVCIPTYNGEKYILRQLQSILVQLAEDDEIIISDDSSDDATVAVIKSIGDSRIKLFENMHFKTPVYNLENALKQAKGEYIFLSDQDDIWHASKVSSMLKYLRSYDLVISNASIINNKEEVITASYFDWKNSGPGFLKNVIKNSYIGCCMAFNRSILNLALPFPTKLAMHDVWIGLIAEAFGNVYFLDEKLVLYRRHDSNMTYAIDRSDDNLSDNSFIYKLSYRFYILKHIILRKISGKSNTGSN